MMIKIKIAPFRNRKVRKLNKNADALLQDPKFVNKNREKVNDINKK